MRTNFDLSAKVDGGFVGSRHAGLVLRQELECALDQHEQVTVNFSGVNATQSFVDEFIGILVLDHGPNVIKRIQFQGCSDSVRSILKLVVGKRARDHLQRHSNTTH